MNLLTATQEEAYLDKSVEVLADLIISDDAVRTNVSAYRRELAGKLTILGKKGNLTDTQLKTNQKVVELIETNDDFWKQTITRFNIRMKANIEDSLLVDGNRLSKDFDDSKSNEKSLSRTVGGLVKYNISKLVAKDVNFDIYGTPIFTTRISPITGLEEPINFNNIFNDILRATRGTRNIYEMIAALRQEAIRNPSLISVAEALEQDLNKKDNSFSAGFYPIFRTQSPQRPLDRIGKDGYKQTTANSNLDPTRHLLEIFSNSVISANKLELFDGEFQDILERTLNTISKELIEIKKNYSPELFDKYINIISDFYKNYNINISANELKASFRDYNNTQQQFFSFHRNNILEIQKYLRGKVNEDTFVNNLRPLADSIKNYVNYSSEGTYIKADGSSAQSFELPNFVSTFFDDILAVQLRNTPENRQILLNKFKAYIEDNAMQYSNLLWGESGRDGIFKYRPYEQRNVENAELNMNFINRFTFVRNEGIVNETTGKYVQYSNASPFDWKIDKILKYFIDENTIRISIPIPADSTAPPVFITMPRQKLESSAIDTDGKWGRTLGSKTETYRAFRNIVFQDIADITQAAELLFEMADNGTFVLDENANLKVKDTVNLKKLPIPTYWDGKSILDSNGNPTGKIFNSSRLEVTIDGVKTNLMTYIGLKEKALLKAFAGKYNAKINEFVHLFIEQTIENVQNEYKDILADVSITRNIPKKTWNNPYIYNSEQQLISEFALNEAIAIAEMNNFLVGNYYEFKSSEEYNKRVKQITSPGRKGDLNVLGASRNIVYLEDIEHTSAYLESIVKNFQNDIKFAHKVNTNKVLEYLNEKNTNKKKDLFSKLNPSEKIVGKVVLPYSNIESTDAQSYVTLGWYRKMLKSQGLEQPLKNILDKIESGEKLNSNELTKVLHPIKPFYYNRAVNPDTGKIGSIQIKNSVVLLIPQLTKGNSKLENLRTTLERLSIDEAVFKSAGKVGKLVGTTVDNITEADIVSLDNSGWSYQLDVPNHFEDHVQKIGIQIAKIFHGNINPDAVYTVEGKSMTGKQIIDEFNNQMVTRIQNSARKLINELGGDIVFLPNEEYAITKPIDKKKLRDKLEKSLITSEGGYDSNKQFLLQLENDEFVMPLFIPSFIEELERTFNAWFNKDVLEQKFQGFTSVVTSDALFDKDSVETVYTEEGYDGTEYSKEFNGKLGYNVIGDTLYVDVLVPRWSSDFYNEDGTSIPIDEIPVEVRTVIGYRIPTEAKHSTIVARVVGFTNKVNGGIVIMPAETIAQTGHNFQIDKFFFLVNEHSKGNGKVEFIRNSKNNSERKMNSSKISENERLSDKFSANRIISLMTSVLSNVKNHGSEIFRPNNFTEVTEVRDLINEITGNNPSNAILGTLEGQLSFRTRNIDGTQLKGIAADINAALLLLQKIDAYFVQPVIVKHNLSDVHNVSEFKKMYMDSIIAETATSITVKHSRIAKNDDGSFVNCKGVKITDYVSQIFSNVLDIVKEPSPTNFNVHTIYTAMAMVSVGVDIKTVMLFINQPIFSYLITKHDKANNIFKDSFVFFTDTIALVEQELIATLAKNGLKHDASFMAQTEANLDKEFSLNADELKNKLEAIYKGTPTITDEYYTLRTFLLFKRLYKSFGKDLSTASSILKADKLKAGRAESIKHDIAIAKGNRINIKAGNNKDIGEAVFPTDNTPSIDPIQNAYRNYCSKLSMEISESIFINNSHAFNKGITIILELLNTLRKDKFINERLIKEIQEYLLFEVLDGFSDIEKEFSRPEILGVSKAFNRVDNNSTAKTLISYKNSDEGIEYLSENPGSFINRIHAEITDRAIEKNGFEKVWMDYQGLDTIELNKLRKEFLEFYNSPLNSSKKIVADKLIAYSFFFNAHCKIYNGLAKFIPLQVIHEIGYSKYLYSKFADLDTEDNFDVFEKLFENFLLNHSEYIPSIDPSKYRSINNSILSEDSCVNNHVNWIPNEKGFITVDKDLLKKESAKVYNAFYIKIRKANGEGHTVYRRFIDIKELNKTYFYPVEGKGNSIVKETGESMFIGNRVPYSNDFYRKLISQEIYSLTKIKHRGEFLVENFTKSFLIVDFTVSFKFSTGDLLKITCGNQSHYAILDSKKIRGNSVVFNFQIISN